MGDNVYDEPSMDLDADNAKLKNAVSRRSRSKALLAEIVDAWKAYNKVNAEYIYHLEEGGDADVTSTEVGELWDKLDILIQRAANVKAEGLT